MASKLSPFDLESKFEKPTKVYSLIAAHGLYEAMKAAVDLEIFEYLDKSEGSCTAAKIASDLSLHLDRLTLVLDTCVSLDLLMKEIPDGIIERATYSNTQQTKDFMLQRSPKSLVPYVKHISDIHKPLLFFLSSALTDGCSQWERAFKKSPEELYKNLMGNKSELMDFVSGIGSYSAQAMSWLLSAFELSQYKRLCDLGGSGGKLAYTACTLYPDMKITVFDLPFVIKVAPELRPSLEDCPNQGNVSFKDGDFFKDELPDADLYSLTGILESWGDEKGDILLDKVFKQLPSGGGILIGQSLLDDDKKGPKEALSFSLSMCVITDGGREKSGKEFEEQLRKHGFVDIQYKKNPMFPFFYGGVFGKKP